MLSNIEIKIICSNQYILMNTLDIGEKLRILELKKY